MIVRLLYIYIRYGHLFFPHTQNIIKIKEQVLYFFIYFSSLCWCLISACVCVVDVAQAEG